ncbi:interleukin-6 receptor subunit beta-like isoform X2 [Paramormyrops kingsleyae]
MMHCIATGCLALTVGVALIAALPPPPPTLLDCEFLEHSNATCWWDHGPDSAIPGTSYILQINETLEPNGEVYKVRSCETVVDHCSVNITTVTAYYCIAVTMRGAHGEATSAHRCLHGLEIVRLYPPELSQLCPVAGRPPCLQLQWSLPPHFALSPREVAEGHLRYQVWYLSENQTRPQVLEQDLRRTEYAQVTERPLFLSTKHTVELCIFSAFTRYTVQIRYRYHRSRHWSDWSSALEARTAEGAPSVAPHIWMQVDPPDPGGSRTVILLWKPLPSSLANGNVLGYNTSCGCEDTPTQTRDRGCGAVSPNSTSCKLDLPRQPCACSVSAVTSAGASPPACIRVPAVTDPVGPPPKNISMQPLDDFRLLVRWTVLENQSASRYVVEWFAVTESAPHCLYWQMLGNGTNHTVITERIGPEVRYKVSVRALYGSLPGREQAVEIYTRQGVPSVGPKLQVVELRSNSVILQWEPIPVEQQHGFIRSYTLYWQHMNDQVGRVVVPPGCHRHLLSELCGEYNIHVEVSTDVGQTAGLPITVVVGQGDVSLLTILSCIIISVFTTFILITILWHRERVRRSLCPVIPDPAKGSLSVWVPRMCGKEDISSPEMEVSVKTCDPISELVTWGENDHQRPLMVQDEYINCSAVAICNEVGCVLSGDQGPARGDLRSSYRSYANLMIEDNADHYYPWKSAPSPAYQRLNDFPRDTDFPLLLQILLQDLDASSPVIKSSPLRRLVTHNYEEFPLEKPPP